MFKYDSLKAPVKYLVITLCISYVRQLVSQRLQISKLALNSRVHISKQLFYICMLKVTMLIWLCLNVNIQQCNRDEASGGLYECEVRTYKHY